MLKALYSVLIVLLLAGCAVFNNQKIGKEYETKNGVKYIIEEKGEGRKPKPGEKIKIHFEGMLASGEKFTSSYERNHPIVFHIGVGQVISGWDDVFPKISSGTKVKLKIPYKMGYGEKGLGKVPPKTDLIYNVEFLEILNPPVPFNVQGRDTFALESGLKYIISQSSGGKKVESFKTIKVHYTGYLEDGNIFDSSVERGFPFEFQVGMGQVIDGWEEGVLRMRSGEKFRFIIPPGLAYKERGFPPSIPGDAVLIYDIELLDILD